MTQAPLFPRERPAYPEGFNRLWELWRRNEQKRRAWERWDKLSRADRLLLEKRVHEWNGAKFNRIERNWVPYLATWIRDDDWREPPQQIMPDDALFEGQTLKKVRAYRRQHGDAATREWLEEMGI